MASGYKIGEFAALAGVSTKALRFYDEIGLLRPAAVDGRTRYRMYRPQQLPKLAAILALKELGAGLEEIRRATAGERPEQEWRTLLLQLQSRNAEAIARAQARLTRIAAELEGSGRDTVAVMMKRRPAMRIASMRVQVRRYEEIGRYEQELATHVPAAVMGATRGVLWHRCADAGGRLEGEPFVEIRGWLPRRSFYDVWELKATTVACAYSGLEDRESELAYDAIRGWMQVRGYGLAGAKREIYHSGVLEIQFPCK